eukprot:5502763-Pyramimonas_sp.AAC.1
MSVVLLRNFSMAGQGSGERASEPVGGRALCARVQIHARFPMRHEIHVTKDKPKTCGRKKKKTTSTLKHKTRVMLIPIWNNMHVDELEGGGAVEKGDA